MFFPPLVCRSDKIRSLVSAKGATLGTEHLFWLHSAFYSVWDVVCLSSWEFGGVPRHPGREKVENCRSSLRFSVPLCPCSGEVLLKQTGHSEDIHRILVVFGYMVFMALYRLYGQSYFSTIFFGYTVISAIWSTLSGQNHGPYIRKPVYLT